MQSLLLLLRLCSDNVDEAIKLQYLANIFQSSDYQELCKSATLKNTFEELYEFSKLEALNNSELKGREVLLHNLLSFNKQVVRCISYGNGPELSDDDIPDFTSSKSILAFLKKIHLTQDKLNYTNITETNALEIFSDKTIKSAQECFDMLPISLTKSIKIQEPKIAHCLNNTSFCINIAEFESIHKNFLSVAEKDEEIIATENFSNKKYRFIKVAVVMMSFGGIYACTQFNVISDTYTPSFTLVMLIAAVLFLIWG